MNPFFPPKFCQNGQKLNFKDFVDVKKPTENDL